MWDVVCHLIDGTFIMHMKVLVIFDRNLIRMLIRIEARLLDLSAVITVDVRRLLSVY